MTIEQKYYELKRSLGSVIKWKRSAHVLWWPSRARVQRRTLHVLQMKKLVLGLSLLGSERNHYVINRPILVCHDK
jgi:hypothetical protein